jgi:phosphatidylglycerophosphate synthase
LLEQGKLQMQQPIEDNNAFVLDLLTTLRHEKFSLKAWRHFLSRSWEMSRATAQAHPMLKRSWLRVAFLNSILALAIATATFLIEGPPAGLRLLPGFAFCVIWQQSDLYWHLGLHRSVRTGKLFKSVGLANTFTWLRALGAAYLLGRLVGGLATPSWLALLVLLWGVATDILDGQIARRTATQSKLGQIGDGEADFCLYLAITVILIQNAVLPLWLGLIMLLRFCIPLAAALASYFILAHPVRFGSTVWGKYAGLAQCLYFLVLLAPEQLTIITRFVNFPLLTATVILLIIAPIAQIVGNVKTQSGLPRA